jgi:hypothetical protein
MPKNQDETGASGDRGMPKYTVEIEATVRTSQGVFDEVDVIDSVEDATIETTVRCDQKAFNSVDAVEDAKKDFLMGVDASQENIDIENAAVVNRPDSEK